MQCEGTCNCVTYNTLLPYLWQIALQERPQIKAPKIAPWQVCQAANPLLMLPEQLEREMTGALDYILNSLGAVVFRISRTWTDEIHSHRRLSGIRTSGICTLVSTDSRLKHQVDKRTSQKGNSMARTSEVLTKLYDPQYLMVPCRSCLLLRLHRIG